MKHERLESSKSDRGALKKRNPQGLKPASLVARIGTAERRALPKTVRPKSFLPKTAPPKTVLPENARPITGEFTPQELRKLRGMKNPYGIQKFLDDAAYHLEDTAWSPRRVLAEQSAHCLEGAIFAAAALRANGYPPLLLDFEAEHDTDHVIAIYKENGCWGAVAKSNYTSCRWREPVYKSLRELALSYFNAYFNLRRERTLRRFSVPVNLKRFDDQNWMTTDKDVWFIVYHLFEIKHYPLITAAQAKRLHRVDERLFQAECLGKAFKGQT